MITIVTQLTFKEYLKLNYFLTYRKPVILWITFIGSVMLTLALLSFLGVLQAEANLTYQLLFGIFTVVILPLSVFWSAKKHFQSNARIRETIKYEFTPQTMRINGDSFQSELEWHKTHKVWEMQNWFLIYQSNLVFNLIPKRYFTASQLIEFKELLRKASIPKLKLKN